MGLNSDEQLARQLQQEEMERGGRYGRQAGIPVVVGQPISGNQSSNQVYQGQPLNSFYSQQPIVALQLPQEFQFVPRLALVVRTLALIDVMYIGLYLIMGLLYFVILLPLPIAGYLGASRYNHTYLIWYIMYLVIIGAIRIFVLFDYQLDSISMVVNIVSLVSNAISLGTTAKLFTALKQLNNRSITPQ